MLKILLLFGIAPLLEAQPLQVHETGHFIVHNLNAVVRQYDAYSTCNPRNGFGSENPIPTVRITLEATHYVRMGGLQVFRCGTFR